MAEGLSNGKNTWNFLLRAWLVQKEPVIQSVGLIAPSQSLSWPQWALGSMTVILSWFKYNLQSKHSNQSFASPPKSVHLVCPSVSIVPTTAYIVGKDRWPFQQKCRLLFRKQQLRLLLWSALDWMLQKLTTFFPQSDQRDFDLWGICTFKIEMYVSHQMESLSRVLPLTQRLINLEWNDHPRN